jgi:hypothetical protein
MDFATPSEPNCRTAGNTRKTDTLVFARGLEFYHSFLSPFFGNFKGWGSRFDAFHIQGAEVATQGCNR